MHGAEINLLGWVISAFVSTLLIASAWHKWQDLPLFRSHLEAYGLLPAAAAEGATYALPVAELLAAVLMLLPVAGVCGHALAMGLLLLYAAAMAINVLRGRTDLACGCGGPALRVGWGLVARNLVLSALLAGAAWHTGRIADTASWVTAMGAGVLLWVLYALIEKVMGYLAKAKQLHATNPT